MGQWLQLKHETMLMKVLKKTLTLLLVVLASPTLMLCRVSEAMDIAVVICIAELHDSDNVADW